MIKSNKNKKTTILAETGFARPPGEKNILILPETGFVRLPTVLHLIPVSKSSWWAGIKAGIYPRPVKLSERTSAWRVQDIRGLIERLSESAAIYSTAAATKEV